MAKREFPVEQRRAWMAAALAAHPPLAERRLAGGTTWRDRFHALPEPERACTVIKMMIGSELARARRLGLPTPTILTGSVEPSPDGGGYRLAPDTARVMTDEELADLMRHPAHDPAG
jgi:hypothetical protein